MNNFKNNKIYNKIIICYLFVYLGIGLLTIDRFPLVFVDEPWISERAFSFSLGEGFLGMSFPYSMNDISLFGDWFLISQSSSIYVFGYNIFSIRIVSLLFGVATLAIFYRYVGKALSYCFSLAMTILISVHPYFINSSRICRPEIGVLFVLVLTQYLIFSAKGKDSFWEYFRVGFVSVLAALCHPLGVFVFAFAFLQVIFRSLTRETRRNLIYMIIGSALPFAIYFYNLYKNFSTYVSFGAQRGIFSEDYLGRAEKAIKYIYNYYELFLEQKSLYVLTSLICISIICIFIHIYNKKQEILNFCYVNSVLCLLFFVIFFYAVTHHSRLYVVFFLPFGLISLMWPLWAFSKKYLFAFVFFCIFTVTVFQDILWLNHHIGADFEKFSKELRIEIPPGSKVLGSIIFRTAFDDCSYFAFEDMRRYLNSGGKINDYVLKHKINYIVYEYQWDSKSLENNKTFGTPYEETTDFLTNNANLMRVVDDDYYSTRFGHSGNDAQLPYVGLLDLFSNEIKNENKLWTRIYKVKI